MEVTAPLRSHTTPEVRALLADPLLRDLSHGLGGPYHALFPARFDANAGAFGRALAEAGVDGTVYFAKKANKAAVFPERAAELGLGVDVASHGELREALAHGVRGTDLVVTGPAKSERLLRVAVLQGALVAVDALDELDRLAALASGLGRTARVLLRRLPPGPPSRFGLDDAETRAALRRCADGPVDVAGFSFHLSGYDVRQRADLAGRLVRDCQDARELGLHPDRISIGGGFAVDYVGAEDWRRFTAADRPEHYHAGRTFPGGWYPYHSPVAGADALRAILAAVPAGERDSLAGLLRAAGVRLLVEPGRALLDQAGCTVFAVQGVKDRDGYAILTVDGTSLSLSEQWFGSEFLPDPVLVPGVPDAGSAAGPYPACVGAASCLESDMLTWRKIPFPVRPAVGDLLVYLNTAGYQMDSNESPFHELPLPPKVVVEQVSDGTAARLRWHLDRHP
ncbi:putative amino acid decarboxylase [Streptomyces sp. EAS-AB2608]|uniref:Y4yA family PLP-dependent enzyme n=1 Tax=Streptomyces bangladeshensis TaxID=295352 RepID=A0ABP5NKX0_9ACTN|nr:putative amino acid decarboxylase [Streptomyces sp. EAS-AB2608]